VVVVAATVVVATSGGTLKVDDGFGVGLGVHPVGLAQNFGIELTAESARHVVLDHVTAEHTANVDVRYAIAYTVDGGEGIGHSMGSIARLDPQRIHGARIGDGSRGVAWLIISVVPKQAGHWRLTRLTISYHSWIRHRRSTSPASRFVMDGRAT